MAISANELRLGNMVTEILSGQTQIVTSIETGDHPSLEGMFFINGIWSNDYLPIRISEEWLVKFGFGYDEITYDIGRFWLSVNNDKSYSVWYHGLSNGKTATIKYVHQLQNLFFALTGEELTIKTT